LAQEQVTIELSQARNARRESEEAHKANIEDLSKLARAIDVVMTGLSVSLGPVLPDRLVEEVWCLMGVIREIELSTAQRAVHQVLAMFEWLGPRHLQHGMRRAREDCASFTRDMADAALKGL
jgi:hypothetical protein